MDTMVTLPFATLPAPVALNVNLLETLVHAWEIAKATGQPTTLDQDLAETTLEFARQMISDELRDGTIFAAEVVITEDAHPADRLAAFTGPQTLSGARPTSAGSSEERGVLVELR